MRGFINKISIAEKTTNQNKQKRKFGHKDKGSILSVQDIQVTKKGDNQWLILK